MSESEDGERYCDECDTWGYKRSSICAPCVQNMSRALEFARERIRELEAMLVMTHYEKETEHGPQR